MGLLRSVRGPQGGFELLDEPSAVTVARLVDAVDEVVERRPPVCLLGDRPCNAGRPCEAHQRWVEVEKRAQRLLERTTLADMLGDEAARSVA